MKRFASSLCSVVGLFVWILVASINASADDSCLPSIQVTFSPDGISVDIVSDKDLSNVVLKFCDGSADYKFDNLSGLTGTFSYLSRELAGVWVKSGCNQSGDGPGYGEFFGRSCGGVDPVPTPTPSPTATATPTPEPKVTICHIPEGNPANAQTIEVGAASVAAHLAHGDVLGACPLDCSGTPFGTKVIDLCGVCGGDSSSCKDCAGVPHGGATVDVCGVCNGTSTDPHSCDPCAVGVDQCGVCDGNNECLDCAGIPNGQTKIDCCGVCGGNGKSCLHFCGRCDRTQMRKSLQRVLLELVNGIRISSSKQVRCAPSSAAIVTTRQELANRIFLDGIRLLFDLFKRNTTLCGPPLCDANAAEPLGVSLNGELAKLYNMLREAREGAAKSCGRSCKGKTPPPPVRTGRGL